MSIGPDEYGIASVLDACLFQVLASREWFDSRVLILSVDQLRSGHVPANGQSGNAWIT